MKKIFTLACLAAAAMAADAQAEFNVAPDYYEYDEANSTSLLLLGEKMSTGGTYVSGQDLETQCPFVWNTQTGELRLLVITDDVQMPTEWDDMGNETAWETQTMTRNGSFRAVSANGLAVGCTTHQGNYVSYPVLYDATTGRATDLYYTDADAGGEGYAITDDGSVVAGFYFDENWKTTACVWTNGGKVRTELPRPTDEEVGFPVEYVSCRYMTPDGTKLLGYAQDNFSGDWVAVVWQKQADGSYTVDGSMARALYQTRPYTEVEGAYGYPEIVYDEITDPRPYTKLEPLCLSANGEWAIVIVNDYVDPDNDQNPFGAEKTLRYNLTTGQYDVIEAGDETAKIEFFSIANDGTAAGRFTGPLDWDTWSQPIDAVIWPAGSTSFVKLAELCAGDAYADGWTASAISDISADGSLLMGYASDASGFQTTFVVANPIATGINSVLAPQAGAPAYDLAGRPMTPPATTGFSIVGGRKTLR